MQLQTLFAEVLPNNRLPAQQVTSVTCDSRQVQKGSVFVCIRGTLGDGHNYVAQALQRGAVFVVAQQDCKIPNQLLVEDTRRVYSQLCAAFFGYPARKMQLLALTGTNGKTTSAWMLHHALGHLGIKAGLIGTICNRIGESLTLPARYTTPDAWELQQLLAMMFKQGCTHVVMEASSQAIEQQRLYGCQFSCAAFLNLTPEHLDIHGDVEHYFQSKAMLFEQCDRALLRIDDPYARRLLKDLQNKRMPLLTFGREQQAMLRAEQIQLFSDRCESTLCFQGERRQAKLPLPGEFSVENLMAAVGMLLQLPGCAGQNRGVCQQRRHHRAARLRPYAGQLAQGAAHHPKGLQGQTAGGLWLSGQTRPKQTSVDDTGGLRKCRPCRDDSG